MSQCYSVILRVKFTDASAAARAMQEKIAKGDEEKINYHIEDYQQRGIDTTSVWGLLRVVFADHPGNDYKQIEGIDDGFTSIVNFFNACYSWHIVMCDFFQLLAPYLADDSSLEIWPDSGYDHMTIENHKFIQH